MVMNIDFIRWWIVVYDKRVAWFLHDILDYVMVEMYIEVTQNIWRELSYYSKGFM